MRSRRLTVVISNRPRSWRREGVLVIDSLNRLAGALAANDVERVVFDRCASAEELLHFLAALPDEVTGDVLSLRNDGAAFLSAAGRGGGRVLYALSPADVHFYLQTNQLTGTRADLALSA